VILLQRISFGEESPVITSAHLRMSANRSEKWPLAARVALIFGAAFALWAAMVIALYIHIFNIAVLIRRPGRGYVAYFLLFPYSLLDAATSDA
jgi:hypothetical protein